MPTDFATAERVPSFSERFQQPTRRIRHPPGCSRLKLSCTLQKDRESGGLQRSNRRHGRGAVGQCSWPWGASCRRASPACVHLDSTAPVRPSAREDRFLPCRYGGAVHGRAICYSGRSQPIKPEPSALAARNCRLRVPGGDAQCRFPSVCGGTCRTRDLVGCSLHAPLERRLRARPVLRHVRRDAGAEQNDCELWRDCRFLLPARVIEQGVDETERIMREQLDWLLTRSDAPR